MFPIFLPKINIVPTNCKSTYNQSVDIVVPRMVLYDRSVIYDDIRSDRKADGPKNEHPFLAAREYLRRVFRTASNERKPSHIQDPVARRPSIEPSIS